jgi:hypothetical protein
VSGRSDADYQRYIAALRERGLEPGATADQIKKAHRARLLECHPDHWPGDTAKAAEAQRVNAAKDALDEMAKDGRLTQYALKAERDRRTGGGHAADPLPRTLIILVILGVAGSGKTRGWCEATAQRYAPHPGILVPGDALHVIFACPTIALLEQTWSMLAAGGLTAPVVHMVHSQNTKGGVGPALDKLYPTIPPGQDTVMMMTHAALFERPLPPIPSDWDLVIDEVPDTVQFISIEGQETHYHLTRHVDVVPLPDGDLYQLVPKTDDPFYRMGWIARIAVNRPFDGGLVHYQGLARALLYGRTVIVRRDQWDELTAEWAQRMVRGRTQHAGHLDVLTLVPPHWFRQYRSVTMMGARALTHLTTLIWQKQWHVRFEPDRRFNLPLKHGARQSKRTTIHYIYDEPVTRAFLARKAANGETMFMATCEAVARFHARLRYKPFLWSAPLPGEDKEYGVSNTFWLERSNGPRIRAFDPLLRLPGRTQGLNHEIYQQTYNVALLSIVGFTPQQYELLHRLNLTDEEIDKAMMLDVAYQDALRCNLRVMQSRAPIHITVLDRRIAEDLATMFENVRIMRYPEVAVPETRGKGRGRPSSGKPHQTSTERSRARRARDAARRQQQAEQKRET